MNTTLEINRTRQVAEVYLNRPDVRNAFNDARDRELTAAFAQLGADPELRADRARRPRQGLLCRRRPGLDARDGRLHLGAEPRRRAALADMLWTIYTLPGAGGRAHPRRLLRRRRGPGRGLRRAGRRRGRALLPVRGRARPAAGDHRPVCGSRAGRAGLAALLRHRRALRRRHAPGRSASCTRSLPPRRSTSRSMRVVASARGQRPGGGARPASAWCRTWPAAPIDGALRADTARRIADIRASAEGSEGRAEPSSTSASRRGSA